MLQHGRELGSVAARAFGAVHDLATQAFAQAVKFGVAPVALALRNGLVVEPFGQLGVALGELAFLASLAREVL